MTIHIKTNEFKTNINKFVNNWAVLISANFDETFVSTLFSWWLERPFSRAWGREFGTFLTQRWLTLYRKHPAQDTFLIRIAFGAIKVLFNLLFKDENWALPTKAGPAETGTLSWPQRTLPVCLQTSTPSVRTSQKKTLKPPTPPKYVVCIDGKLLHKHYFEMALTGYLQLELYMSKIKLRVCVCII